MSFYNNLKKPYTAPPVASSAPKPLISQENRMTMAKNICALFKGYCMERRANNVRCARKRYTWVDEKRYRYTFSLSDDSLDGQPDYYISLSEEKANQVPVKLFERYPTKLSIWAETWEFKDAPDLRHMNYDECQRIAALVNAFLREDGFPGNVATIKEIKIKTQGMVFSRVTGSVYCLELNASW